MTARVASLVLASTSSIRKKILTDAGLSYRCLPGPNDEPGPKTGESAADYVLRAAQFKALDAWQHWHLKEDLRDALIVGSDQVVEFQSEILRKVQTLDQAIDRLLSLQAAPHALVNGLAMVLNGELVHSQNARVELTMRPLPRSQVKAYIDAERPLSSVACYYLEGQGIKLIQSLQGSFFAALGLPLMPILDQLTAGGYKLYGSEATSD